ncbi:hypothetical protein Syun_015208 [Stephania yunnanensis]|uniref:Uncharacterized protein n=1 Tax=Stephania yunnanensis TaxID=152371 RepID=A0AAP0P961_9MAGN
MLMWRNQNNEIVEQRIAKSTESTTDRWQSRHSRRQANDTIDECVAADQANRLLRLAQPEVKQIVVSRTTRG